MAAYESKLTWRRFRGALNESLAADADALAFRSRSVTIVCKNSRCQPDISVQLSQRLMRRRYSRAVFVVLK